MDFAMGTVQSILFCKAFNLLGIQLQGELYPFYFISDEIIVIRNDDTKNIFN